MVDYMDARGKCPDCGEFQVWSDGSLYKCIPITENIIEELINVHKKNLISFLLGEAYRPLLRRAIAARLATSMVHTADHIRALDLFDSAFPTE